MDGTGQAWAGMIASWSPETQALSVITRVWPSPSQYKEAAGVLAIKAAF